MEKLAGKKAIITGAGKGIGKAIAMALATEGVHLGLIARTKSDLEHVAAEMGELHINVFIATADVSDEASISKAIEKLKENLGDIDILINNAGIANFGGFTEMPSSEWENMIKINLFGTYYTTKATLPGMIARKTGDIVNIASTAGLRGTPNASAYCASKFAVMGLTESLMQEVRKHNIRVTALTPSTVNTDMAKNLNLTDGNPDKVMQPEDFAELIVSQLKLNRRVFVKEAGLWSTNP